jgi:hypothetical protein
MHSAILMAQRRVPGMLRAEHLWPFDCERRCGEMVSVPRGPDVAAEMTRNIREPFKSAMQKEF